MIKNSINKGELVIATEGNWVPWTYHDVNGKLVGFDVDVAREVCSRLGVAPKFIEVEWERILPGVESGAYDVAFNGVKLTDERRENFYFTRPYVFEKSALIAHKDDFEIRSFNDLKGKTCANAATTGYADLAEKYGGVLIIIDSFDEEMELVAARRVETTINSEASFYDYMNEHPSAPLKIVDVVNDLHPIAVPCRKSEINLPMIQAIDKILDEMRQDGTLRELSMKYFGKDMTK